MPTSNWWEAPQVVFFPPNLGEKTPQKKSSAFFEHSMSTLPRPVGSYIKCNNSILGNVIELGTRGSRMDQKAVPIPLLPYRGGLGGMLGIHRLQSDDLSVYQMLGNL
jgi:hypothetical protein